MMESRVNMLIGNDRENCDGKVRKFSIPKWLPL
ncbi:unnamed protein product, partial [Allacma fusca]